MTSAKLAVRVPESTCRTAKVQRRQETQSPLADRENGYE
jgi:hypothetical protein